MPISLEEFAKLYEAPKGGVIGKRINWDKVLEHIVNSGLAYTVKEIVELTAQYSNDGKPATNVQVQQKLLKWTEKGVLARRAMSSNNRIIYVYAKA